jgi:hypothetical protein
MTNQMALLGLEFRHPSEEERAEHRQRMAKLDSERAKIISEIVQTCDPFTGLAWDDPQSFQDCSL